MSEAPDAEYLAATEMVAKQVRQTVQQEAAGVTLRLGTLTCPCGWTRSWLYMYRCLHCSVWFCHRCAEQHFGKTVDQYKAEKRSGGKSE